MVRALVWGDRGAAFLGTLAPDVTAASRQGLADISGRWSVMLVSA